MQLLPIYTDALPPHGVAIGVTSKPPKRSSGTFDGRRFPSSEPTLGEKVEKWFSKKMSFLSNNNEPKAPELSNSLTGTPLRAKTLLKASPVPKVEPKEKTMQGPKQPIPEIIVTDPLGTVTSLTPGLHDENKLV